MYIIKAVSQNKFEIKAMRGRNHCNLDSEELAQMSNNCSLNTTVNYFIPNVKRRSAENSAKFSHSGIWEMSLGVLVLPDLIIFSFKLSF